MDKFEGFCGSGKKEIKSTRSYVEQYRLQSLLREGRLSTQRKSSKTGNAPTPLKIWNQNQAAKLPRKPLKITEPLKSRRMTMRKTLMTRESRHQAGPPPKKARVPSPPTPPYALSCCSRTDLALPATTATTVQSASLVSALASVSRTITRDYNNNEINSSDPPADEEEGTGDSLTPPVVDCELAARMLVGKSLSNPRTELSGGRSDSNNNDLCHIRSTCRLSPSKSQVSSMTNIQGSNVSMQVTLVIESSSLGPPPNTQTDEPVAKTASDNTILPLPRSPTIVISPVRDGVSLSQLINTEDGELPSAVPIQEPRLELDENGNLLDMNNNLAETPVISPVQLEERDQASSEKPQVVPCCTAASENNSAAVSPPPVPENGNETNKPEVILGVRRQATTTVIPREEGAPMMKCSTQPKRPSSLLPVTFPLPKYQTKLQFQKQMSQSSKNNPRPSPFIFRGSEDARARMSERINAGFESEKPPPPRRPSKLPRSTSRNPALRCRRCCTSASNPSAAKELPVKSLMAQASKSGRTETVMMSRPGHERTTVKRLIPELESGRSKKEAAETLRDSSSAKTIKEPKRGDRANLVTHLPLPRPPRKTQNPPKKPWIEPKDMFKLSNQQKGNNKQTRRFRSGIPKPASCIRDGGRLEESAMDSEDLARLLQKSCEELSFSNIIVLYTVGEGMGGILRLTNLSSLGMFFRVSPCCGSDDARYIICPSEGKLEGKECVLITLTTSDQLLESEFKEDVFKIETVMTSATTCVNSRRFWMNPPESKIRVAYTTSTIRYHPQVPFIRACLLHSSKSLGKKECMQTWRGSSSKTRLRLRQILEDIEASQQELNTIQKMEHYNLAIAAITVLSSLLTIFHQLGWLKIKLV